MWDLHSFLAFREDRVNPEEVDAQYSHFAMRARERFGYEIDRHAWDKLCFRVFVDDAFFRFQHSLGTSVYEVSIGNDRRCIYWSERYYCASTILPETDYRLTQPRNYRLIHLWRSVDNLRKLRQRDALLLGEEYMGRLPKRIVPQTVTPKRDPERFRFQMFEEEMVVGDDDELEDNAEP